jgi:hypothetical protein
MEKWQLKQLERMGWKDLITSGKVSAEKAYQYATGRKTEGLYLKVQPGVKELIETEARKAGKKQGDWIIQAVLASVSGGTE